MKKGVLVLSLLLTISLIPAYSATPPKAGSECSKLGINKTYQDKKYTCVKSGRKLVWDKGVPITSESPSQNTQTKEADLSKDSPITSKELLSNVDICKTIDNTDPGLVSNGFPRPAQAIHSTSTLRVLILPLNFADSEWSDADIANIASLTQEVTRFYKRISYGRVDIKFTIVDKSLWWKSSSRRSQWSYNQDINDGEKLKSLEIVIKSTNSKLDFGIYNAVMLLTTPKEMGAVAIFGSEIDSGHGIAKNFLIGGAELFYVQNIAHELGHSLYGLEDLYLAFNRGQTMAPSQYVNESELFSLQLTGDLMADGTMNFIGWNRLLNGWLDDSQIRCITNQSYSVHYLSDLNLPTGQHLLLINLMPGVTVVAEVNNLRLKLYYIDSYIHHAQVPIRESWRPLIANSGKSDKEGIFAGWKFSIIASDKNGILFDVTKVGPFIPAPSPKSPDDINGFMCSVENQIVRNSIGEFWCLKDSNGTLRWAKNNP